MWSIDLHNYFVDEAYQVLIDFIDEAVENGEKMIEVIHGYTRGSKIKEMVAQLTSYDHPAISRIQQALANRGSTYIYFKER